MTEEQVSAWLDAYADAFVRQNPDAAVALFTPDATYQWGPFGDLLQGAHAIRAKWAQATEPHGVDVRFDHEVLAVTDTIGIARWMASYSYPREGRIVRYDGIFAVSLTGERLCNEFREWWNSQEEPLATTSMLARPT